MTPGRKIATRSVAAFTGIAAGVSFIILLGALGGGNGGSRPRASPEPPAPTPAETAAAETDHAADVPGEDVLKDGSPGRREETFLAWAPGSLPPETESTIDALTEVRVATTVYAGLDWIEGSTMPGAKSIQRPAPGYAIPFEIAAIQPHEYARFADPGDRRKVKELDDGEALLAETARDLRGAGRGLRIDLGERRLRVVGTVGDKTTNGYEALIAGPPPSEWTRSDRFVLARLEGDDGRRAVERKIESLLPAGQPLQTRTEGENPFLRYGDSVLPQLLVKETFGEFAARPLPDGTLDIESSWMRNNIRTESVPILGDVTCHRVLFPQLREALRDIERQGLGHAIHPQQFAGCFSARFINSNPNGRLSHHSWGIAVDLNAPENSFGTKADIDMRIVEVFEERWGFTWGGRWIIPDGMHFEWVKFP